MLGYNNRDFSNVTRVCPQPIPLDLTLKFSCLNEIVTVTRIRCHKPDNKICDDANKFRADGEGSGVSHPVSTRT